MKKYVFAISGATGSVIGIRVLRELVRSSEVHLIISSQSFPIIRHESGIDWVGDNEDAVEDKIRIGLKCLKYECDGLNGQI